MWVFLVAGCGCDGWQGVGVMGGRVWVCWVAGCGCAGWYGVGAGDVSLWRLLLYKCFSALYGNWTILFGVKRCTNFNLHLLLPLHRAPGEEAAGLGVGPANTDHGTQLD